MCKFSWSTRGALDGYSVITAGDDNAIVVSMCRITPGTLQLLYRITNYQAHASAVTALSSLDKSAFASTGPDCRLNVWQLVHDGAKEHADETLGASTKLILCKSSILSIHDIQSMAYTG